MNELNIEPTSRPQLATFFDFITNPKKVVKDCSAHPPHSLGIVILLLVCLELVLNFRLLHDLGASPMALSQFTSTLVLIVIAEALVMITAHKIGRLFYKNGDLRTVRTFFNLSLWPLLLVLPFGLFSWTVGLPMFFNGVFLFFISGKILTDWKIILDRHYQFNRWQSALVLLALGGIVYTVIPIVMFFMFIGVIGDFIALLR